MLPAINVGLRCPTVLAEKESTTRLQYAVHLSECPLHIGNATESIGNNHRIHGGIRQRNILCLGGKQGDLEGHMSGPLFGHISKAFGGLQSPYMLHVLRVVEREVQSGAHANFQYVPRGLRHDELPLASGQIGRADTVDEKGENVLLVKAHEYAVFACNLASFGQVSERMASAESLLSTKSRTYRLTLVGPTYPYRGGIAHFQQHLSEALREAGHQVEEVTFRRQYPKWLFPGKTQWVEPVHTERIRAPMLMDTLDPLSYERTARYIARTAPDAVVIQYWMPFMAPALGTLARRLRHRGIPVYAVVHNALPHESLPGMRGLTRYFLKSLRGAITLSRTETEKVRALAPRLFVQEIFHPIYDRLGMPLSREEARQHLGLPQGAPILLFFGLVRPYKGLWTLLRAVPAIRAHLPDVRVLIAGEFYEDPAPYEQWITEQGLTSTVQVHNRYIPDEEVRFFFSASDVVVQPYRSATQSGVVQTAYHFERSVIATSVGGIAERVHPERTGFLVPPDEPEALAQAVVRFFQESWQPRLEAGVRQEKQKYTWEAFVQQMDEMLQRDAL